MGEKQPEQGKAEDTSQDLVNRAPKLSIGSIARVIPGTYTMTAKTRDGNIPDMRCLYVPGMMSSLFGAKDCSMPTEGTPVLLLTLPEDPDTRIALCCLPEELRGFKDLEEIDWVAMFGSSAESGINYWSADSYLKEGGDPKKSSHTPANSDRPWSMLPGEWAQGNPMGVLIGLFHFMATLKATERAKIECFVFDDLVRLTSGQFQHWNAFGETHIFDDAGMNSIEVNGSHTAPEVRGYNTYEDAVITTETQNAMEERFKQKDPKVVMKRRFRMFMGGLGDMVQIYLRNMQDGNVPDTYDAAESWGASFKMHLDNSGSLDVVSSAGIGASLNDRIPVPKRVKEAWDPEGDKPETPDTETYKKKEHFDYDDQDVSKFPYMRNIKAMDGEAWESALSYQRFDELKKDFVTPETSVTEPPASIYDALESNSRQSEHVGCKAGWRIEQDGSVRIWDNWGGEIYMRGGDIVLACPGQIIMQAGKGIVGMANDIVMKAKTSVDITATDKDVRLGAGQNVMAYAKKGMLFEADGETDPVYPSGVLGEDVPGGGIVFKAKSSSIYLWGKTVTFYSDYFFTKIKQAIVLSSKVLAGVFTDTFMLETDGKAGVYANGGAAQLFGTSVSMSGANSANVFKGTQAMVPMTWADIQQSPYDSIVAGIQNTHTQYSEEGSWMGALVEATRDDIKFTYRTPVQYGTDHGTEVYMPANEMTVYQTRWQLQKKMGYAFIQGTTEAWKETEVNGTFPYPGLGVRERAYASVDTLSNVAEAIMRPLDRKDLTGKFSSQIQRSSLDSYIIIK